MDEYYTHRIAPTYSGYRCGRPQVEVHYKGQIYRDITENYEPTHR